MRRFIEILPWIALLTADTSGLSIDDRPLTEEDRAVLDSGEVLFLEPTPPYLFNAAIQIDASAEVVWALMQDHDRVPDYVAGLEESKVLESGDNWKVVEHRLKLHPLLPRFYYVFREEYGPGHRIVFDSVKGSFKELTGWWKIQETDREDQVIVMYSTYVEVGWYIPKSWIRSGIRNRVPELLFAFREVVHAERERKRERAPE